MTVPENFKVHVHLEFPQIYKLSTHFVLPVMEFLFLCCHLTETCNVEDKRFNVLSIGCSFHSYTVSGFFLSHTALKCVVSSLLLC
jgi:hypothetical protein